MYDVHITGSWLLFSMQSQEMVTEAFKAQKGIKDIDKLFHVASKWIHFVHKGNKNNVSLRCTFMRNTWVALLSVQGQKALGFHQKYLNLCPKDEQSSYWFGIKWGCVILWQNLIFLSLFCNSLPLPPLQPFESLSRWFELENHISLIHK